MDLYLPQQLQHYINSELASAAHYRAMAEIAPGEKEKQLFLELADNDQKHAEMFKEIHQQMAGQYYEPPEYQAKLESPYQIMLRQMLSSENTAFQEYHSQYLKNPNLAVKSTCHKVSANKSEHINKLMAIMVD